MQIRSTQRNLSSQTHKPATRQKATPPRVNDSPDTVSLMGETGRGALRGGAGGMLAAGLIVAGGALNMMANGDSIDMGEFGLALGQATGLAVTPSILVGATTGALSHAAGLDSSKSRTLSVTGGAIAGGATIAYSVYQVIKALDSFMG